MQRDGLIGPYVIVLCVCIRCPKVGSGMINPKPVQESWNLAHKIATIRLLIRQLGARQMIFQMWQGLLKLDRKLACRSHLILPDRTQSP